MLMDILIILLSIMGVALITSGTGAGVATLFGNRKYRDKTLKHLPSFKKTYAERVVVNLAYKDLETGKFHAEASSKWSGHSVWITADSSEELRSKLEEKIPWLQEKSREYKRRKDLR
jgi:hypothetical protein